METTPLNFDDISREAAIEYRLIDALVGEMENAGENTLEPYKFIRQFYTLHRRFYKNIVLLSLEEGERDRGYEEEIREEQRQLARMCHALKKDASIFLVVLRKHNLKKWSEYFAHCVTCIVDDWAIDPESNMIVYCPQESKEIVHQ